MLFLGVDQSLRGTGIALIRSDGTCFATKTIVAKEIRGAARLDLIRRETDAFIAIGNASPDGPVLAAAMEGGSFQSTHRGFDLGAVFGVLQADLFRLGLDPLVVAPVLVKKFATGHAQAKKDAIVNAVKTRWGITVGDDNQADAVVLAMIARAVILGSKVHSQRYEVEVVHTLTVPKEKRTPRVRIPFKNLPNL